MPLGGGIWRYAQAGIGNDIPGDSEKHKGATMFGQIPNICQSEVPMESEVNINLRPDRQNCQPHNAAVHRYRGKGICTDRTEAHRLDHAGSILCQALEARHSHEG